MREGKRQRVGLFVEGSQATKPLRPDFTALWKKLAEHCGHEIELLVYPVTKKQILLLKPADLPARPNATNLVKKGQTQIVGGGEPLDVTIDRAYREDDLDRVVIGFDRWPPNQELTVEEQEMACQMRPEVAFVLRRLAASGKLPEKFRGAALALLTRYESTQELQPRQGPLGALEVLFMNTEFEALFIEDEATVRKALGIKKKKPHDWKAFPKHEREYNKSVLDRAIFAATNMRTAYSSAPARWGRKFVEAADANAKLWRHPIVARLCRTLGG
jgi:hypothetical protein